MERLRIVTQSVRHRIAVMAALTEVSRILPWCVAFLTPCALLYRFEVISEEQFLLGCVLAGMVFIVLMTRAAGRSPGLLAASLLVDRVYGFSGRFAAAIEFSGVLGMNTGARKARAPSFEALVIDQAPEAESLSAAKVAPIYWPQRLSWGLLMVSLLFLLVWAPPPRESDPSLAGLVVENDKKAESWLSEDDAELLKRSAKQLTEKVASEQGEETAQRFNEIVLKVVSGEVSRGEALQLAAELQAELDASLAQGEQLRAGLEKRGESLEERAITQGIGKALREQRYEDAEEAFRKLAERLEAGTEALSEEELEQLREALHEARESEKAESRKQEAEEEARERRRQSLQKKRDDLTEKKKKGTASKQEQKELARTERELKRLDRQKKQPTASQELSELDKKLAEAAKDLAKERKKSGQFLNEAGRQVSQAAKRQLTDQEKRELLQQIEEMKERLRRQNQDGKQAERLKKFQQRARGQQGKPGGTGKGRAGQGQKGQPGEMRLGPGGEPVPMPGQGEGPGKAEAGSQEGEQPGVGKEAGHAHDPNLVGEASRLEGAKAQDAAAVAQDTGEGHSASETIRTAAEEGFSSTSYERLFREYRTAAEEVMEKESVPPGRKAHVRRYFELIRPRGETPEAAPKKDKK